MGTSKMARVDSGSTAVVAFSATLLVLLGCTGPPTGTTESPGGGRPLTIVATTTILGDVVGNVIGDDASLEVLLPVGADPHEYRLSSRQVALVIAADLVVANGLLLEEGMIDVLEAAEADGANLLELAPLLDPIPFGPQGHDDPGESLVECDPGLAHQEAEEAEDGRLESSCDPHFWNDPLRVARAARIVASELAAIDDTIDWSVNAESYAHELEAADAEVVTLLQTIPDGRRKLITNHDSLGYFAQRHGFEVLGTVIPSGSTLADPSSAELADLVELIRAEGITAIFAETIERSALADAVAAEVGEEVRVVELYTDSLGPVGSGADSLIGMLITNAELIAGALR